MKFKNSVNPFNSRMEGTEERYGCQRTWRQSTEITQYEQQKTGWKKLVKPQIWRVHHISNQRSTICVIGVPEGEEKEYGAEKNIRRNNGWKFPKFGKWHKLKIQEAEHISSKIKPKKSILRHILINFLKRKSFESSERKDTLPIMEKQFKEQPISHQNLGGQEELAHFPVLKKKENCEPQILYLATIFFRNEEKIKTLSDEGKLVECVSSRPTLKNG